MLSILVDESYAFDFISILDVKLKKYPSLSKVKRQRDYIIDSLKTQIGAQIVDDILSSREYMMCIDANDAMFDLVDKAKRDEVTAQDVDRGNYKRCEAKRRLQLKFFNIDSFEIKIGYEKYKEENNK